jgi:hypothetical protein
MNKQHLLELLDEKTSIFERDSNRHKKLHLWFRYATFGLSSLSGILAGLSLMHEKAPIYYNVGILIVAGIASFIASIEGLRKPGELWIHERTTFYALTDLRREVDFLLDDDDTSDLCVAYFGRMQSILGAAGEKWSTGIVSLIGKNQEKP